MDAYNVFRAVVDRYVSNHAKIVGHDPFDLKINFATYISVLLWYSFFMLSVYTACTGDREDAMLSVFFALFSTQVSDFNTKILCAS